jgi:hypothetical protein
MATEEHGAGKQMVSFRVRPKWSVFALVPVLPLLLISLGAAEDGAFIVSALSACCAIFVVSGALRDAGFAVGALCKSLRQLNEL